MLNLITMLTAINLHNQRSFGTHKTCNEVANLMLAAKLVATDLSRPKSIPQSFLNFRSFAVIVLRGPSAFSFPLTLPSSLSGEKNKGTQLFIHDTPTRSLPAFNAPFNKTRLESFTEQRIQNGIAN